MSKLYKLLLVIVVMVGTFVVFSGGSASAQQTLSSSISITSSDGNRALCTGGTPVDFKAGVSGANFDANWGRISYNVDLDWQTCSGGSTRAYAIYSTNSNEGLCPVSGTYGADATGYAYDCLKYIGSPPYEGPGNGLTCPAWGGGSGQYTNEWCVNSNFNAIRKEANQPPTTPTRESIAMSRDILDWNSKKNSSGSHTFVTGSVCQYYKTGANWVDDNRTRCMQITVTVSWWVPQPPVCSAIRINGQSPADVVLVPGQTFSVTFGATAPSTPPTSAIGDSFAIRTGDSGSDSLAEGVNVSSSSITYDPLNATMNNVRVDKAGTYYVRWRYAYRMPGQSTYTYLPSCSAPINIAGCSLDVIPSSAGIEAGQNFRLSIRQTGPPPRPFDSFRMNIVNGIDEQEPGTAASAVTFDPGERNNPTGTNEAELQYLVWKGEGSPQNRLLSLPNTGQYTARVRILWKNSGGAVIASTLCTKPFRVVGKPYFKAFGNDVAAGGQFGTDQCGARLPNQKASILAFAKQDGAVWTGAGSQLANFALGEIWDYMSAATHSQGTPYSVPPKGLTIGNYFEPDTSPYIFGGRGGQFRCAPDYYTVASTAPGMQQKTATNVPVSGNVGGFYTLNGGTLTLIGGQVSGRQAVVVDGDVYISGSIGYTTGANIPSLYVIARGNIYINPSVANLSGVFIAQPREGKEGVIYTCADASGPIAAASLSTTCNNKLTINGAFIANQVRFLRTGGTLNRSGENESWNSGEIAEVFKSSGQLYLSAPDALKKSPGVNNRTYDSVTSLPPIL